MPKTPENATVKLVLKDIEQHLLQKVPGLLLEIVPMTNIPHTVMLTFKINHDDVEYVNYKFRFVLEIIDILCQKHGCKRLGATIKDNSVMTAMLNIPNDQIQFSGRELTGLGKKTRNSVGEPDRDELLAQSQLPEINQYPELIRLVLDDLIDVIGDNVIWPFAIEVIEPASITNPKRILSRITTLRFFLGLYESSEKNAVDQITAEDLDSVEVEVINQITIETVERIRAEIDFLIQKLSLARLWFIKIRIDPKDSDFSAELISNIDRWVEVLAKNQVRYEVWFNDREKIRNNYSHFDQSNEDIVIKLHVYSKT